MLRKGIFGAMVVRLNCVCMLFESLKATLGAHIAFHRFIRDSLFGKVARQLLTFATLGAV